MRTKECTRLGDCHFLAATQSDLCRLASGLGSKKSGSELLQTSNSVHLQLLEISLQYFSLSRRGQTAGIKERHQRTYPICELSRLDDILKEGEGNASRWHLGNITSICHLCVLDLSSGSDMCYEVMRANKTDLDHSALHDQGDVGVEEGGLVESET